MSKLKLLKLLGPDIFAKLVNSQVLLPSVDNGLTVYRINDELCE